MSNKKAPNELEAIMEFGYCHVCLFNWSPCFSFYFVPTKYKTPREEA